MEVAKSQWTTKCARGIWETATGMKETSALWGDVHDLHTLSNSLFLKGKGQQRTLFRFGFRLPSFNHDCIKSCNRGSRRGCGGRSTDACGSVRPRGPACSCHRETGALGTVFLTASRITACTSCGTGVLSHLSQPPRARSGTPTVAVPIPTARLLNHPSTTSQPVWERRPHQSQSD